MFVLTKTYDMVKDTDIQCAALICVGGAILIVSVFLLLQHLTK